MYYGWRGKIGHVCPAIYDTGAYEFERVLPDGVITVTVTLNVQQLVPSEFERAAALLVEGAKKLAAEDAGALIAGGDPIIALTELEATERSSTTLSKRREGRRARP